MTDMLSGKSFVISGASSGIGRACAIAVSAEGADVVIMGRSELRLADTLAQLKPGDHRWVAADMNDPERLADTLNSALGDRKVDGFVACAGVRPVVPVRASVTSVLREAFTTNVFGTLECIRILTSRRYMKSEGGSIVLMTSIAARSGGAGLTAYAASKSALEGAARAMASELAPRRIRINCLEAGHVEDSGMWKETVALTPQYAERVMSEYPLGIGVSADVASVVVFLLSDKSRWITGSTVLVDGGHSVRS